jgi:protein-S-isoprenylcysteine O-methyltransferase Ste14
MSPFFHVLAVLACFAVFHDSTANEKVKAALQKRIRISTISYTGLRALISLVLLIISLVLLFRDAESTHRLFTPHLGVPAILPAFFAFWIAGIALRQVSEAHRLPQFFGFRESPRLFIYSGAYSLCRHPMYTGWLVACWGLLVSKPYMLTVFYNLLLTAYIVFMALSEERRMIALFGDRYRAYRKQTPFLLPYGFLKFSNRTED